MVDKLCVFCKNFYLDAGDEYYSEWTPGTSAQLKCRLGYWDMENNAENARDFRSTMQRAKQCKDYEEASDAI